METLKEYLCPPAVVYAVIATILLVVGFIIRFMYGSSDIMQSISHLLSITICALVLTLICKFSTTLSWGIVVLYILSVLFTLCGLSIGLMRNKM